MKQVTTSAGVYYEGDHQNILMKAASGVGDVLGSGTGVVAYLRTGQELRLYSINVSKEEQSNG